MTCPNAAWWRKRNEQTKTRVHDAAWTEMVDDCPLCEEWLNGAPIDDESTEDELEHYDEVMEHNRRIWFAEVAKVEAELGPQPKHLAVWCDCGTARHPIPASEREH